MNSSATLAASDVALLYSQEFNLITLYCQLSATFLVTIIELSGDDSLVFAALDPSSPLEQTGTNRAQIATMPMTSNMADTINNIDNVNTNPYPNNAISPGGGSTAPIINYSNNSNTNNISANGGAPTVNNEPLESLPIYTRYFAGSIS